MSDPLEELRKQRALIAEHLRWLDVQIGNAEKTAQPQPAKEVTSTSSAQSQGEPVALHKDEASVSPAAVARPDADKGMESIEEGALAAEIKSPQMGRQIVNARIGCLALFIGATLLFLFLLFGLPYLL